MKYLKRLFESTDYVNEYLSKMGATKEDIIDIFQGIIDLGYKPIFDLRFIDINGKWKDVKTTSEETPVLKISFKTNNVDYVGGSIKFDNLDYLEDDKTCTDVSEEEDLHSHSLKEPIEVD